MNVFGIWGGIQEVLEDCLQTVGRSQEAQGGQGPRCFSVGPRLTLALLVSLPANAVRGLEARRGPAAAAPL